MSVKRLLHVFRTRKADLFTGFTHLNIGSAVQHRLDDIEYEHTGSTLLTKAQAASLVRQMAETLEQVVSNRCDVLNRIAFPVLKEMDCRSSLTEDPLSHYILQSCPMLQKLRIGSMNLRALEALPLGLKVLHVESFDECEQKDQPLKAISRLSSLTHLSFTADCVKIADNFFAQMHDLQVVELMLYIEDEAGSELMLYIEDEDEDDHSEDEGDDPEDQQDAEFGDTGVQLLLQNNAHLRQVTLSGLNLSNLSLHLFEQYCKSHGLQTLSLKSVLPLDESAVMAVAKCGSQSLKQVSILSDDPEEDLVILIEHADSADEPTIIVKRGAGEQVTDSTDND